MDDLSDDIAAASAAYLCSVFSELAELPATEVFIRLQIHFRTAILAYQDAQIQWGVPEPSKN